MSLSHRIASQAHPRLMAALVGLLAAVGIAVGAGANFDAAQGQSAGQDGPGAGRQAR